MGGLTGSKGLYYDRFLDAIRDEVCRSTFSPAQVGNCKIRQVVQSPFTFKTRWMGFAVLTAEQEREGCSA